MYFYGFFQTENKFSKNLMTLPTFSANKCQNFKISVLCREKNWSRYLSNWFKRNMVKVSKSSVSKILLVFHRSSSYLACGLATTN